MLNVGLGELVIIGVVLLGAVGLGVLGVVLLVTLIRGTQQKTALGINLSPPNACPKCARPLPKVRVPTNARQFLWGGWTCAGCGVELDKWGRVLP